MAPYIPDIVVLGHWWVIHPTPVVHIRYNMVTSCHADNNQHNYPKMFISTCPIPCQGLRQQQQGEPNTASSCIQNVRMLVSHVYIENGVHPNKAIWLSRQQRVWRPESLVLASWEPLTNWPRHHWRHPPHIGANHPSNLGSNYFSYFHICFPIDLSTKKLCLLAYQTNCLQ